MCVHTFSFIQFWQIPVDVGYVHYWQTKFETIPHLPQYWNYAVPNMTKGLYAKNFKMSPTRVRYPARDGPNGVIVMESPLSDMTWASFLLLQWPLSTRAEVHVSAKQGPLRIKKRGQFSTKLHKDLSMHCCFKGERIGNEVVLHIVQFSPKVYWIYRLRETTSGLW